MGSKLQHSRHLLINLLKHNTDVAAAVSKSQDTWINFKYRPMDRLFEKNSREYVRNTMLRQEQIFKQQVHELHRLYQVQKLLMAEMRTKEAKFHSVASANAPTTMKDARSRYWSSTSTSETSHSSYINNSIHQYNTFAEDHPAKTRGFDLEQPVKEEISASLDRSKEAWADEECDVELRLSIGCGMRKKKSKHWLQSEPNPSDDKKKGFAYYAS